MASLRKIPNCRFWIACFRDLDGKVRNRSTRVPDEGAPKDRAEARRRAQVVADGYERTARGKTVGEAQVRRTITELLALTGTKVENPTLREFFADWLLRAEKAKRHTTTLRYRQAIRDFLEFLGPKGRLPFDRIAGSDVQEFLDAEALHGKAPKTISNTLKILRIPFAEAVRLGTLNHNPAGAAKVEGGVHSEERMVFTPGEVRRLIETLRTPEDLRGTLRKTAGQWVTAINFGYFAGLRLGDATSLQWKDLDLIEGAIRFRPEKTRAQRKEIVIPLPETLQKHLLGLSASDDPEERIMPLLSRDAGSRAVLSKQFSSLMRAAGVDSMPGDAVQGKGRRFNRRSFHALRHSYISALASYGVPAEIRQKLSGHADLSTHLGYTHHELKTLRGAVANLPSLEQ